MFRSFRLTLKPTAVQRKQLERMLGISRDLYNAAVQERRDAWRLEGKNIFYIDQQRQLTEIRQADAEYAAISVEIMREPLRRVHRAFQNFFSRVKTGQRAGFPRFRSRGRYKTLGWPTVRFSDSRLLVPSLGRVRFKPNRLLSGTPKTATLIRKNEKKWVAQITCDIGPAPEKVPVSTAVGVDLGLKHFLTLSDGSQIENPRWLKQHEHQIAQANQMLARKKRGSKNRERARLALNRTYERLRNSRRNFTHHVSKWLVQNYDLIAYEKLNIKGMVQGRLSKSILDAAWGELIFQLSYKAESAGRWAIPVNPKGTSQRCSGCETVVKKSLAERAHVCPNCGLILDRDHNAAINILRLGECHAGFVPSERLLTA